MTRKRAGRTFYGCSNYNAEQKCDFKLWQKPVPEPCPKCEAKFLTRAGGKKPMLVCATKDCGYKRELDEDEAPGTAAPAASPSSPEASEGDGEPKADAPKPKAEAKPKAKAEEKPKVPAKAKTEKRASR